MIHKPFGIMIIFCFILIVLPGQSFSSQAPDFAQLLSMAENSKLADSERILAPFYDGQEYINVLVSLMHSPEAEALSLQSTASVPENFQQPPGTLYFNLKDENVKTQLRDTVRQSVEAAVSSFDSENIRVTRKFTYVFGFSATVNLSGLQQLLDSEQVVSVSEDMVLEFHLAQGIPLMRAEIPRTTYDGSGISIAICDSGIDTSHPRLGNGGSPIFNSKVIGGYDVADLDADPRPAGEKRIAHGTACAGISAGNLGSVGDYIGGVAPGAKLYSIKMSSDNGSLFTRNLLTSLEWALTHQNDDPANPIMIISMSAGSAEFGFSGPCDSYYPEMTQAAMNAVSAGISIFVSSGNDGFCDSISFPACISCVNSVGAVYDASFGINEPCVSRLSCATIMPTPGCRTGYYVRENSAADMVTSYSNSANFLTILGPSNNAYTTDIVGASGYSSGDYISTFGGTSAACPYVAGAAAVLQSAAKAKTGKYLTPEQVKYFLTNFGDNIIDGKVPITKPRVNLAASVSQLSAPPPPPPGGEGDDKDFPWVLLQPIINKKVSKPPPPSTISQWGVYNTVCCTTSITTFSVTLQGDNITKSSTVESCSSTSASFSGFTNSTSGPKSFIFRFTSPTCGTASGSFNFTFINNMRYLIQLEYQNGKFIVRIYSAPIPSNQANDSMENLNLSSDFLKHWVLENTVVFPSAKNGGSGAFFEQWFPAH